MKQVFETPKGHKYFQGEDVFLGKYIVFEDLPGTSVRRLEEKNIFNGGNLVVLWKVEGLGRFGFVSKDLDEVYEKLQQGKAATELFFVALKNYLDNKEIVKKSKIELD